MRVLLGPDSGAKNQHLCALRDRVSKIIAHIKSPTDQIDQAMLARIVESAIHQAKTMSTTSYKALAHESCGTASMWRFCSCHTFVYLTLAQVRVSEMPSLRRWLTNLMSCASSITKSWAMPLCSPSLYGHLVRLPYGSPASRRLDFTAGHPIEG